MIIYHIVITELVAEAVYLSTLLGQLNVPDVKLYGHTVQVRIPGHIPEQEHFDALRSVALSAVDGGFKMGRASGD